jgi:serine/threonine protein kinase
MECLDANVVQDLMSGALDEVQRAGVLGHLDACEECRELLGVTARDTLRDQLKANPYPDEIAADARRIINAATTVPSAGNGEVGLLETAASDGAATDAGLLATAAAASPHDLLATPVMGGRAAEPPTQGRRLGRYTLLDRLGAGAMGVVWRAEDPTLGRHIAVKLLRRQDETLTERLVREAQSMAQVNHPNVVTVYEVGEGIDGSTFIAMELVTGESLRKWQGKTRHTIPELINAYIAAGRGLAAAHAAGIIHRDFKPDNVLVDIKPDNGGRAQRAARGDDGRVRVTDFGLAAAKPTASDSLTRQHIGDVNLTTSGSVLGTPAYMAPEQFVGGNVDPRTDQFNFCVALYEALYGERPFDGVNFADLADNVCAGKPKPPPAGTNVSGALRAIVLRGLSVKPGDRFPTMDDLIRELGRDRAKPWRRTSIIAAAVAVGLGLGVASDWVVRDRVSREIRHSFALTREQQNHVVNRLIESFKVSSEVAYREPALREVAGHHDQADFGLGDPATDRAELEKLHNTLVSTDWVKNGNTHLGIADYKGRLLFTSASPETWGGDVKALAPVKEAIDAGKGDSVTVLPYSDPGLRASGILGPKPPSEGVAVLFVRTLALGDKATEQSEARSFYLQLLDGRQLLDEIVLDKQTKLALVALDGSTAIGELPPALIHSAPADDRSAEVSADGQVYQVQSLPMTGLAGQGTIAHVVMARPLDGVLSLFPNARFVFTLATLAALGLAAATFIRARQITGARI